MPTHPRPLSPHLQVYRPQITSVLSITHRATGVGLAVGALVLAYWLSAASYGDDAFNQAQAIMNSPIGVILLIGWTWAFYFHLCNGLRHLAWDAIWGFKLSQVYATGWLVVGASVVLTALTWLIAVWR
jgi:succinate dehydrogenase / fumarate reductase cytochrome b subunit